MRKKHLFIVAIFSIAVFSCKKEAELIEIPGNQPPPDNTISSVVKESYINKVYISVLGREPEASELSSGLNKINQHNLSMADREAFLDEVFNKPEYYQKLYETTSIKFLNSFDTGAISEQIYLYDFLLTDSTYAPIFDLIHMEKARMIELKNVPADLNNGTLTMTGMHRRMINNNFYDEINMGTENFVVSTFQHFMDRYPTATELEQGKSMVDGLNAIIFLTQGNTKDNYMDIILGTSNYFEGQVRELYLRYLFRQPTSAEMVQYTAEYKASLDYIELQKTILSTDEYVGIN
ncbi:MAG: hypothetical protein WAQ28_11390 [Bacteroidia bacterium]|jgi:hypothetical protein